MEQSPTIDRLLNLVPDASASVLSYIRAHPDLASKQDAHGYSLLHAATSYEQLDLLRALIQDYHVDPNIVDEDGETCLFNAESVEFARHLIALGVKLDVRNVDGLTAAEKLDDEDEQPEISAYLKGIVGQSDRPGLPTAGQNGASDASTTTAQSGTLMNGETARAHPPPPLPEGVQVNIATMQANEVCDEPDPEFRRRIEELAERADFEGEEGQRELRSLVSDAVSGMASQGQGPPFRRRVG